MYKNKKAFVLLCVIFVLIVHSYVNVPLLLFLLFFVCWFCNSTLLCLCLSLYYSSPFPSLYCLFTPVTSPPFPGPVTLLFFIFKLFFLYFLIVSILPRHHTSLHNLCISSTQKAPNACIPISTSKAKSHLATPRWLRCMWFLAP